MDCQTIIGVRTSWEHSSFEDITQTNLVFELSFKIPRLN